MRSLGVTFVVALTFAAFAGCGGGGSVPTASNTQPTSTSQPPAVSQTSSPIQLFSLANYTAGEPITQPSPGVLGANELNLTYTVVGQIQYVLVFEPGFTGTFTFSVNSCTLSPPAVTLNESTAAGPQAVLGITAASAGSCAVKITDGTTANTAEVAVVVTTTSGTISVAHPR
jgi:hypothetical protein